MEAFSRPLLRLCAGGLLLLPGCSGREEAHPPKEGIPPGAPAAPELAYRPSAPVDVILIVVDTLRGDALVDPEGRYDTPRLDRLARDGVRFTRAFAAAPMTLPSHMSLFSSRSPFETKVLNNGQDVPSELPLVAEWLNDHDYDTRAVVSMGTINSADPDPRKGPRRGFESFEHEPWCMSPAERTQQLLLGSLRVRDASRPLFLFAHFADPHEPYDAHGSETTLVDLSLDGKPMAKLLASESRRWSATVELPAGRSTFELALPEELPRRFRVREFRCLEDGAPLQVQFQTGSFMERLKRAVVSVERSDGPSAPCQLEVWINDVPGSSDAIRARYALEVAYVDRYVGDLLDELVRLGLYDDSLIVFTSDHGEALGEHKFFGHVERLTEEMLRVPLIVKLPRSDPRHARLAACADRLVSQLDLVPTILDVAGLPPLTGQRGRSLFEHEERVHVAETHRPEAKKDQVALRDERFNMVYFPDEERFVLYDLAADPSESTDVFARRAAERPDWPARLKWIFAQSQQHYEPSPADDEAREAMLRALGYSGEE